MPALDPLLSLALAMQNTHGAYALLLGSGVSRPASIPTGWEIVEDLVRKIAALEGQDATAAAAANPAEWYSHRFGAPPTYSQLIEQLANTQTERRELLRPYFEPNEEERAANLKVPTPAHRAIARLMRDGIVGVALTTNFDRLLETALVDVGVAPSILSTADSINGMLPLRLERATIVKLHGDYLDTRIRNTDEELEHYDPTLDKLLDSVLDEYGLVVCGWSAKWDAALRSAITRCPNRRFSTFWATHGELATEARDLIERRKAQVIEIESADAFFDAVAEKVATIESLSLPHPLSTAVAVATMKRYLPAPEQRIRLHDLITDEVTRAIGRVTQLVNVRESPEPLTKVRERMTQLEGATETVTALMATGVFWDDGAHRNVWTEALEYLGNIGAGMLRSAGSRYEIWTRILRYPAQLAFYAAGLAAVARGKDGEEVLLDLLLKPRLRLDLNGGPTSPAWSLTVEEAVEPEIARGIPGWAGGYTPMSDHLWTVLRPVLSPFLREQATYDDAFDRFECLVALAYAAILETRPHYHFWAPPGRLAWRRERIFGSPTAIDVIGTDIDREGANWLLLRRGLFDGSVDKLAAAREQFNGILNRRGLGA